MLYQSLKDTSKLHLSILAILLVTFTAFSSALAAPQKKPNAFVFTIQPTSVSAGTILPVEITAVDKRNRRMDHFNGIVNITLINEESEAELHGITEKAFHQGKVLFNLAIARADTNYTLEATIKNITTITSNNFDIAPGAASQMAILSQPHEGTPEVTLTPPLQIGIFDHYGNHITDAENQITVSLNPVNTQTTLRGTTTQSAGSGVASFYDLSVNHGEAELTFRIQSYGLPDLITSPIRVGQRFQFNGIGEIGGIFDPSIEFDPHSGRLWMSYSAIEVLPNQLPGLSTRLAFSDNAGATWEDAGITINGAQIEENPPWLYQPPETTALLKAAWWHEVASLSYDPISSEWSLIWHRYLYVEDNDPNTDNRQFAFGWIARKTASTPVALADPNTVEEKLFTGSAYDYHHLITEYNDSIGASAPPIRLNELGNALAHCMFFTEPGSITNNEGRFVALYCKAEPNSGQPDSIELLKQDQASTTWHHAGTLLNARNAEILFSSGETQFNAAQIYQKNNINYLIVSPESMTRYAGCLVYEFENLNSATLKDINRDNEPDPIFFLNIYNPHFNGACSYHERNMAGGVIYGVKLDATPSFRLYSSGFNP